MKESPDEGINLHEEEVILLSQSFRDLKTEISNPQKISKDKIGNFNNYRKLFPDLYASKNRGEVLNFLLEAERLARKITEFYQRDATLRLACEAIHNNANSENHPTQPLEFLILYMTLTDADLELNESLGEQVIDRISNIDISNPDLTQDILTFYSSWIQFLDDYLFNLGKETDQEDYAQSSQYLQ
jgi:hypothetical protein